MAMVYTIFASETTELALEQIYTSAKSIPVFAINANIYGGFQSKHRFWQKVVRAEHKISRVTHFQQAECWFENPK